jgi:SAM-dependent methyltransferase
MDNSLEHTFDPLGTLLELYRVLRPGGLLVIAVPNAEGLATQVIDLSMHWGHWFLFTPRVLAKMLAHIGFRVTQVFARQYELRPELVERGMRAEDHAAELDFVLEGDAEVARVGELRACADFFHVVAEKPESAGPRADDVDALEAIAAASLRELESIDLEPVDVESREVGPRAPAVS